jgi:REP element-mobilizing transposase RayT
MYHIVCPSKYHRAIFSDEVDIALKEVCEETSKRYEIVFLEIVTDSDNVHFLVQSVPMYSPNN